MAIKSAVASGCFQRRHRPQAPNTPPRIGAPLELHAARAILTGHYANELQISCWRTLPARHLHTLSMACLGAQLRGTLAASPCFAAPCAPPSAALPGMLLPTVKSPGMAAENSGEGLDIYNMLVSSARCASECWVQGCVTMKRCTHRGQKQLRQKGARVNRVAAAPGEASRCGNTATIHTGHPTRSVQLGRSPVYLSADQNQHTAAVIRLGSHTQSLRATKGVGQG